MTTQTVRARDQRAQIALETVVRQTLQTPAPVNISIAARDNHSGEPAIYVYVVMPAERDIPDISAQNRLVGEMISALERIDDERFPYLHFGPRADDPGGDEEATFGSDEDAS